MVEFLQVVQLLLYFFNRYSVSELDRYSLQEKLNHEQLGPRS